jgi:hypothetical protein
MPELDPPVHEPDQPRVLGRLERARVDSEAIESVDDELGRVRGRDGRDEHCPSRVRRERLGPPRERPLDRRPCRERAFEGRGSRELLLREQSRQLEQRERVPRRRLVQSVGDVGDDIGNQARGRLARQSVERERVDARRLEGPLRVVSGRVEHEHAIRLQPPRCEEQRVLRRAVEPLHVVDDDE